MSTLPPLQARRCTYLFRLPSLKSQPRDRGLRVLEMKIFHLAVPREHIINIQKSLSSSSSFCVYIVFVEISYCGIHRVLRSTAHREVTIAYCPEQRCPAIRIFRLHVHLRSSHHSLHYLQLSSFAGLIEATTMRQVLCLVTATQWMDLSSAAPSRTAHRCVLTKSVQRRASMDMKTSNCGFA